MKGYRFENVVYEARFEIAGIKTANLFRISPLLTAVKINPVSMEVISTQ